MNKNRLVRVIRQLASTIEAMEDAEVESLFAEMRRTHVAPASSAEKSTRRGKIDFQEIDQMLGELRSANTREVAIEYLRNLSLTRHELTIMARRSHVHITKEDAVPTIEQKLVEALVGARLNSLAIRGGDYPNAAGVPPPPARSTSSFKRQLSDLSKKKRR